MEKTEANLTFCGVTLSIMNGRILRIAVIGTGLLLAFLFIRDHDGDRRAAEDTPAPMRGGVEAEKRSAGMSPAPPAALPGPEPVPGSPTLRDIELALEAAVAEREAAVAEVRRAQQAVEAVEEQLGFRIDQGEAPDDLIDEADASLAAPFRRLQDALRRLEQAEVSENVLREQLAAASEAASRSSLTP